MKKLSTIFAGLAVAVLGVMALALPANAHNEAISETLQPGDNIQSFINSLALDDTLTLTLTAGTYDITQAITIENGKVVSVIGDGDVTINLTSPTPGRALKIYDTSNVTISNINLTTTATGNNPPTWGGDIGVDLSNACNVTLDNVSISGFGKFGVEVTAAQTGTETNCAVTNGVTFNNLTVTNSTGGIAFYDDSTSGVIDPISNVKFNGTTTISGTGYGIDVNDAADVSGGTLVTSPKAQNLNLGTLNISGVTSGAIIAGAADRVVVANDSVINGTAVSSLSASQLETLLGLPAGVITISGKPAAVTPPTNPTKPAVEIPGAPNTGDSSNSLAFIVISIVAVLSAAIVGAIGITRFARKQS